MKRIIRYVLLLASFSLITTSCKKEEVEVAPNPKSNGEKIGEELKQKYNKGDFMHVDVYLDGVFLINDTELIIDKQYLIVTPFDGRFYKFDLNKMIYYKLYHGSSENVGVYF